MFSRVFSQIHHLWEELNAHRRGRGTAVPVLRIGWYTDVLLDASLTRLGLKVITTPVRSPQANSLCERLIGTLRRECLDWTIPLSEGHLRKVLASWIGHYNRGRPHSSLGPGIPDPRLGDVRVKPCEHRLPLGYRVVATPILGGLHHEYSLQRLVA
jgi:putative transposase